MKGAGWTQSPAIRYDASTRQDSEDAAGRPDGRGYRVPGRLRAGGGLSRTAAHVHHQSDPWRVHPKIAQQLARHSTITLTMDRYSHTMIGDLAGGLDALPELSPSKPESERLRATGTCDITPKTLPISLPKTLPIALPTRAASQTSPVASHCTKAVNGTDMSQQEKPVEQGASRASVHRNAPECERSGRDSNPRYGYPHTAFPVRPLQPLGHRSTRLSTPLYRAAYRDARGRAFRTDRSSSGTPIPASRRTPVGQRSAITLSLASSYSPTPNGSAQCVITGRNPRWKCKYLPGRARSAPKHCGPLRQCRKRSPAQWARSPRRRRSLPARLSK